MPVDHHDFKIVKLADAATPLNIDGLAVDPTNPNATMAEKDWIIVESYSSGTSQGEPVTFTFAVSQPADSPRPDGTSNTLMIGEVLPDDSYVLTAIQHGAVDTFQSGFNGGITVASGDVNGDTDTFDFANYDGGTAAGELNIRTGTWITDTTYETGSHALYQDVVVPPPPGTGGAAVAMETITIANEGLWLI
jgi:hypothetical protein